MNAKDWEYFYTNLKSQYKIPFTRSITKTNKCISICDLFVNMNEVFLQREGREQIKVYADVIQIPKNFSYTIKSGYCYLFAREIIAEDNSNILMDFRSNNKTKLVICSSTITGKLKVTGFYPQEGKNVKCVNWLNGNMDNQIGVCFQLKKSMEMKQLEHIPEIDFLTIPELERLITVQYQIAVLYSYYDREISANILQWMLNLTKNSNIKKELSIKLTGLLNLIQLRSKGERFLPALDKDTYYQEVVQYVDLLKDFETEYIRVIDKSLLLEERKKSVSLLCNMAENYNKFKTYSLEQARKNYEAALESVRVAKSHLENQAYLLESIKNVFYIELEYWYNEKKIELSLEIIKSVVTFTFSIITAVVGIVLLGPAGTAAAAPAASSVKALAGLDTKDLVFAEQIKILIEDTLKKSPTLAEKYEMDLQLITKTGKQVENTIASFSKVITLINQMIKCKTSDSQIDIQLPNLSTSDMENNLASWKIYSEAVTTSLKKFVDKNIPSLNKFMEAFSAYLTYGEACIRTKAAAARAGQEYISCFYESEMDNQNEDLIRKYVEEMEEEKINEEDFGLKLSGHMVQIKEWLVYAMENYRGAYFYWTLSEPEVAIKPNKNVMDLKTDFIRLYQGYKDVLISLNPPPQQFKNIKIYFNEDTLTNFQQIKEELQQGKKVILSIPDSHAEFQGQSRIRLDALRIWLKGISYHKKIRIQIENSGEYQDKKGTETFYFISTPIKREFQYIQTKEGKIEIQKDGTIDNSFKKYYCQPTPFTQWEIQVNTEEMIDFYQLTDIVFELEGTSIAFDW